MHAVMHHNLKDSPDDDLVSPQDTTQICIVVCKVSPLDRRGYCQEPVIAIENQLFASSHKDISLKPSDLQARGAGGAVAESGALVGNQNSTADAEAANGPDPSIRRGPSPGTPSRTADGTSSAPANGNAEHMENGEVGKEAKSESDG